MLRKQDTPINMYDPKRDLQNHKEEYLEAVNNVLDHGFFINGPEIAKLERKLSEYTGVKHCIGVANGTDALMIALMAFDIGKNSTDEVITVSHTWISTAEVIALLGAKPVFVDIESDTFNLDVSKLESAITENTKAIMPVSLYGQMPDYEEINRIAGKYGIPVIEDGAQSFGAKSPLGKSCGVTTIGCTSFFPSKPLGCWGDGGAIFTNDDFLAQKIRAIKGHGCLERFKHMYIGLNARLDTLQAAILNVKFKYLEESLQQRQAVAQFYTEKLTEMLQELGLNKNIQIPIINSGNTHVWAQYTIIMETNEHREKAYDLLKKNGINVAIFYPAPLHLQECFKYLGYDLGDLPKTEEVAGRILNLPCYAEINREEQEIILEKLREILKILHD